MRSFVIATTDGVLLYSLDNGNHFDPYHLEANIKPGTICAAIQKDQYLTAIMQALKLNDATLIRMVFEKVPDSQIQFVVSSLPLIYCERALSKLAVLLESNPHLEFILIWIDRILRFHGLSLKNSLSSNTLPSVLRLLQRNLMRHLDDLDQVCTGNKYTLRLLRDLHEKHQSSEIHSNDEDDESESMIDEMDDSNEDEEVSDSDDELIQKMLQGEDESPSESEHIDEATSRTTRRLRTLKKSDDLHDSEMSND